MDCSHDPQVLCRYLRIAHNHHVAFEAFEIHTSQTCCLFCCDGKGLSSGPAIVRWILLLPFKANNSFGDPDDSARAGRAKPSPANSVKFSGVMRSRLRGVYPTSRIWLPPLEQLRWRTRGQKEAQASEGRGRSPFWKRIPPT